MKITLEINTSNEQDIIDAINSLKTFVPKENFLIQEANFIADKNEVVKDNASLPVDFDVLDEINLTSVEEDNNRIESEMKELKTEVEDLKELIKRLKEEKVELKKNNEDLTKKISNLETELAATPMVPELNQENESNVSEKNNEIEEYKKRIDSLTKDVAFHETRSNKNFEEVKKLRNLIDSCNAEKRNTEKKLITLQKEFDDFKANINISDLEENSKLKEFEEKIISLENTKEKLLKDVEFHKNRSKTNWEEVKVLKGEIESLKQQKVDLNNKVEELSVNSDNIGNKEEVDKLKLEMVQLKSEYESIISELRLTNDKVQNEINLYKTKYSDSMITEFNHLKKVRDAICSYEKGASFWNNVENNIVNS